MKNTIGNYRYQLLIILIVSFLGAENVYAQTEQIHFSIEEKKTIETLSANPLPTPPPDITNKYADDPRAVNFGKKLFEDPRFSGPLVDGDNDGSPHTLGRKGEFGKVACVGCHLPEKGFSDFRTLGGQISLAAGWDKRKAPSLLDVAQSPLHMWDGRHDSLNSQIFSVIESPVEMNSSRLYFAYQVFKNHRSEYEALFGIMPDFTDKNRFPELNPNEVGCRFKDGKRYNPCLAPQRGSPGDGAEYDSLIQADKDLVTQVVINVGKAISAFQRTLTCKSGRFDKWVSGDSTALTNSEQLGLKLFISKAGCVSCHNGPFFSDQSFHNVGLSAKTVAVAFINLHDEGAYLGLKQLLEDPLNSKGKFSDGINKKIAEIESQYKLSSDRFKGAFKTPMLRCVSNRPSYMHTGQIKKLEEVLDFFNRGGDLGGYPGRSEIRPLSLTSDELVDLHAFLSVL